MKLEYWIYFEPGEKEKLIDIMQRENNILTANIAIQEEFNVSMTDAAKIIDTYNKRIKK